MALPLQSDIKIRLPNEYGEKSTILLSASGDLQLVTGKEKLSQQMFRALVNKENYSGSQILNTKIKERELRTLVNSIFRVFKSNQVKYVNETDPSLSGYSIWRKAATLDEEYQRISDKAVIHKFIDTDNLLNNTEYSYAISRIYNDVFETKFIDIKSITPSAYTKNHIPTIGGYSVMIPGNRSTTIYVDYNKRHQASSLIDEIKQITLYQDPAEPRQVYVGVTIKTLFGEETSIGTMYKTVLT